MYHNQCYLTVLSAIAIDGTGNSGFISCDHQVSLTTKLVCFLVENREKTWFCSFVILATASLKLVGRVVASGMFSRSFGVQDD